MSKPSSTPSIHHPDSSFTPDQLHVIAIVHNPLRYRSRDVLFQAFVKHMEAAGVTLHIVEAAFGERDHRHTWGEHQHIMVQHSHELWMKESMINLGFSRLPGDWKYAAWIDGDIQFSRPDWAVETIHQLQHYRVVQMFQTAADLGPTGEIIDVHNGFGWSQAAGLPKWTHGSAPQSVLTKQQLGYYFHSATALVGGTAPAGKFWHPGYAWAIRRETFDDLGGLIDWSALGSADHIMAMAMIGEVEKSIPGSIHPNYLKKARQWQELANEHVRKDVGFVPGSISHFWHGAKRSRFYVPRWDILTKHQFDPELDIRRDHQGLVHLTRRGERMRDDLRTYFRSRNEDGVEL